MARRTNFERIKAIYEFIEKNEKVFKTDFKEIGFNINSVVEWMKIFHYIHKKPEIKEFKKGRLTIYEFKTK